MSADETPLFDVPNLDCLSTDPGDLLHAAAVFSLLALYAEHKGRARAPTPAGGRPRDRTQEGTGLIGAGHVGRVRLR